MVFKKTIAKATPTVTVETKKMDACCASGKPCCGHHIVKIGFMVLTVLNTVLLIALLGGQDKAESLKVGGDENYKLLKQIFLTDGYKAQQKQQIEQALQMFANPEAAKQQAQGQAQAPAAQQQVQQQAQPQVQR